MRIINKFVLESAWVSERWTFQSARFLSDEQVTSDLQGWPQCVEEQCFT